MNNWRRMYWYDPRDEMPRVESFVRLLIVPKSTDNWGEPEIGHYIGDDQWEYAHSSPAFTTDSVAFWAYIPEPPNE